MFESLAALNEIVYALLTLAGAWFAYRRFQELQTRFEDRPRQFADPNHRETQERTVPPPPSPTPYSPEPQPEPALVARSYGHTGDPEAAVLRGRAMGMAFPRGLRGGELVRAVESVLEIEAQGVGLPAGGDERAAEILRRRGMGQISHKAAVLLWPQEVLSVPEAWTTLRAMKTTMQPELGNAMARRLESGEPPPVLSEDPWRRALQRANANATPTVLLSGELERLYTPLNSGPRGAVDVARRMVALYAAHECANADDPRDRELARRLILSSSAGENGVLRPDEARMLFARDPQNTLPLRYAEEGASALAWALEVVPVLPLELGEVAPRPMAVVREALQGDLDGWAREHALRPVKVIEDEAGVARERYEDQQAHLVEVGLADAEAVELRSRAAERWRALVWLGEGGEHASVLQERLQHDLLRLTRL